MNEDLRNIPQSAAPTAPFRQGGQEIERTPEMIGAEIRTFYEAGRRVTMLCGIEIGRRLTEAKEMLKHGEWLPWLEKETTFSERHAQNYMRVFREYGAAQLGLFGPETKAQYIADLPISKALALLYLPESERDSFAAEVEAETISVRELETRVRERTAEIEAEKATAEAAVKDARDARWKAEKAREEADTAREAAENARRDAEATILRMKREIAEIEARPQTVAVERDEKAIEEAVAAERARLENEREAAVAKAANAAADAEREKHAKAEKEAKARIAELEKQIKLAAATRETIEKELKDAQAKAAAAEKTGADSAALQQQVETLKKQLSLAAPEVAEFKAAFDRAQDELVHMNKALHEIRDEEIREKLRKACAAMLAGFQERVNA